MRQDHQRWGYSTVDRFEKIWTKIKEKLPLLPLPPSLAPSHLVPPKKSQTTEKNPTTHDFTMRDGDGWCPLFMQHLCNVSRFWTLIVRDDLPRCGKCSMKNSNVEHARRKLLFKAEGGSSQIGSELDKLKWQNKNWAPASKERKDKSFTIMLQPQQPSKFINEMHATNAIWI